MSTQIFSFNGQDVRVIGTQAEPLFVAKDICDALGLANISMALQAIDGDDINLVDVIDSIGRQKQMKALSESGLYTLVLRSDKPEAKAFKKWVTSEVLPSIRKHGAYATAPTIEAMLSDPDVMIKTLTALKEERIAKINAQLETKEAQKALALESSAKQQVVAEKEIVERKLNTLGTAVRDLTTEPSGTMTIRDAAKMLASRDWNVRETELRASLQEHGWLTKGKGPTATAYAIQKGFMAAGGVVINHLTGWSGEAKTPKLTGKGFTRLVANMEKLGFKRMSAIEGFFTTLEGLVHG